MAELVSIKNAFQLVPGREITLRGWVRSRRDSKGITFIELNDGTRFRSMQLVVDAGLVPEDILRQVTTGSSIAATALLRIPNFPSARPLTERYGLLVALSECEGKAAFIH